MTAQEYFGDWYKCINQAELDNVVAKLKPLYKSKKVHPEYKNIFEAFRHCRYNDLKVVFVGMDPYNDGSATGIAFANRKDCKTLSPSLRVIKECLEENYEPTRPFDNTLLSWEKQGVLLLNSALTVEDSAPGSHSVLWKRFIASFLKELSTWQTGLIFVLLGEKAKNFRSCIGPFNDFIECKHPAYYARNNEPMPNIFQRIDEMTRSKNNVKINWI